MHPTRTAVIVFAVTLGLAGCSGDHLGGFALPGSSNSPAAESKAAPVSLTGRWLLSSPSRGQCHMTFASATPTAVEGTVAPEGGCPGKFYMSRKWSYEQGNLIMRDHNGQPLAQLSNAGATFEGKATSGEPITLLR
jgi:hypothetical protein